MAIDSVIFGFGFRARSGKDTAVAEIVAKRGLILTQGIIAPVFGEDGAIEGHVDQDGNERYDVRKYSFADALRREVDAAIRRTGTAFELLVAKRPTHFVQANENLIELPEWVVFDPNGEVTEQYPLGKQRTLLQWWGTEYRRSIDPDYWVRQLANTIELEKPQIALITDMRFPNEMDFVKQYGETILVQRDTLVESTHASETALAGVALEDWSIILDNNGTLEEFKEGAVTCFDELLTNFPSKL